MRVFAFFFLAVAAAFAPGTSARADDCVDTSRNNSAFSSDYISAAKPCPTPAVVPSKPMEKKPKVRSDAASTDAKSKTASAKQDHPDKPTVTTTPGGTLMKSGDTTVCVSGSVSVEMVAGASHNLGGKLKSHHDDTSACEE